MRFARAIQTGRAQAEFRLYSPTSIFRRKLASNAALAPDQTPALLVANQCNYGNPNYTYDSVNFPTAPAFYGYPNKGTGSPSYANMGWAGFNVGFQTTVDYNGAPYPFYVVDDSVPTQTVTYVNYTGPTTWTSRNPGDSNNLQSYFNAVPVPDVTKITRGQIWTDGNDRTTTIWRPTTNELWEMWRLYGSPGSYIFGYGAYTNDAANFNGIWPNNWGSSASSLSTNAGAISIQDIVDVLRGDSINHALGLTISVTANAHVAPATRHDSQTIVLPNHAFVKDDGSTANQSAANSGFVDAVAEGTWFRLPSTFNPSSAMPGAGPIALAIATAIRDYGLYVHDGGGNTTIKLEDARVLGSPYSYAKVNPFGNVTGAAVGQYDTYINNHVDSSWTDSSLPAISEKLHGTNNVLSQIPWQQLQVLQPFSS